MFRLGSPKGSGVITIKTQRHCGPNRPFLDLSINAPQQRTDTITAAHVRAFGLWPQVFHGGPFGVWGTPPTKPLDCKVWDYLFGAYSRANLLIPISKSVVVAFRYVRLKQKTLLTFGKQGWKILILYLHLLTRTSSKYITGS